MDVVRARWPRAADEYGVELVSLEELLRQSDFVSMHTPLLTLPNVILTPHIASASDKARVERARWMGIEPGRVLTGHWPINGLVNRGVTPRAPLA
jgi:phosphoglycerate dehydrogenase-like enzyme